jgi:hypothetical protein
VLDQWTVYGVDFSSAPSPRKPITVARGRLALDSDQRPLLRVEALTALPDWPAFDRLLGSVGPWIGGFDFPFGLPRELVETLGWPLEWSDLVTHFGRLPRAEIREVFKAFCDARPPGGKFAHRATDGPAGSSPSMKWVNPPVAWMFHAGAPRLLQAGLHVPGLHDGDPQRIALEAYPGLLARSVTRESYKSDEPARQTAERARVRQTLVQALLDGRHRLGLPVAFDAAPAAMLDEDPRGDWLDAVFCAVQAGWALTCGPGFGRPVDVDPIEGWIVGAEPQAIRSQLAAAVSVQCSDLE